MGIDPTTDRLLVRQHERVQCCLSAEIELASENGGRIKLARSVGDGRGGVRLDVIDCSGGGVGLRSSVFFPKSALLNLRVVDSSGNQVYGGTVRVQRASMTGREPTYYLGAAFHDRGDMDSIQKLLNHARTSPPSPLTDSLRRATGA